MSAAQEDGHHPPKRGAGKLDKIRAMLGHKDHDDVYHRLTSQGVMDMPTGEFGTFWKRLVTSPGSSAKFVASVVEFFVKLEKNPEATAAKLKLGDVETLHRYLTLTLHLIDAFCAIDTNDDAYKSAFEKYKTFLQQRGGGIDLTNSAAEAIRALEKRGRNADMAVISVPRLIVDCTMLSRIAATFGASLPSSVRSSTPNALGNLPSTLSESGRGRMGFGFGSQNGTSPTNGGSQSHSFWTGIPRTVWDECVEDYPFDFHKLMIVMTRAAKGRQVKTPRSDPASLLQSVVYMEQTQGHNIVPEEQQSAVDHATLIFDEMVKLLSKLPQQLTQMKGMQEFTQDRVLALFLVARIFLTYCPGSDTGRLLEMETVLMSFLTWPLPVSGVATDLIRLCQDEMRSPGTILRQRILVEVPSIYTPVPSMRLNEHLWEMETPNRRSSVSTGVKDDISVSRGGEGLIHVFIDANSIISNAFCVSLARPTETRPQRTRSARNKGLEERTSQVSRGGEGWRFRRFRRWGDGAMSCRGAFERQAPEEKWGAFQRSIGVAS
eukprot:scaffold923_cov256-Pinguiococcus_pyrenoidosus.AAC.17